MTSFGVSRSFPRGRSSSRNRRNRGGFGGRVHLESLEPRLLLTNAGEYSLVADLFPGLTKEGSSPEQFTQVGTLTFFVATTEAEGDQLWKTDGTTGGTQLVRDIRPGAASAYLSGLVNVNGTLFFSAYDDSSGAELWKSDGTAGGTVLVKDIISGPASSGPSQLTAVGSVLFFSAEEGTNGEELWKSDGTAAGTVLVKDINAGASGSYPEAMIDVGGTLYFQARTATNGAELWKSNGTSAGTTLVKDISAGSNGSYPQLMTNVGGTLFFGAYDPTNNYALWKSNGTTAGTVVVRSALASSNDIDELTPVGNTLFFTYDDGSNGEELWKSDGTAGGTVMVKDINPGSYGSTPRHLANVGGTLYFAAEEDTTGFELWKSDGTSAGTSLVTDIDPGSAWAYPRYITNVNGTLFFSARSSGNDYELWKSNGTAAGTVLVKDVFPGSDASSPEQLFNANGKLLFVAQDGVVADIAGEPFVSDGTPDGTGLLKDIQSGTGSAEVTNLTNLNGTLIYSGTNAAYGTSGASGRDAVWKLNGSTPELVKDLWPGSDLTLSTFVVANNLIFFSGDNGSNGTELWKTDGTTAGTTMVLDINPDWGSSTPRYLTAIGNVVYFSAYDGTNGVELWRSDGTEAGTWMVKDIAPGSDSSIPYSFVNVSGILYFTAKSTGSDYELWKSDGTSAGTVLVKDIRPGSGGSFPGSHTNVNGTLYFSANDGTNGSELWKSDGTSAGTTLVKNIASGSAHSFPAVLSNVGGTLYFRANDGTTGAELWKSDGTSAGTTIVSDIRSGATGSGPANLVNLNGTLFFVADNGLSGKEVWKSNGTGAGTTLLKDIFPGAPGSSPELSVVANTLWINANDGINGERGWSSDGTTAGTVMPVNATGQPVAIDPTAITEVDGVCYFSAISVDHGRELFRLGSEPVVPPGSAPTINQPASPTASQRPLISWSAVTGATEYEVWIKNQSTNTNPFHTATVAETSYVPTIDLGIGRFNLWVRAKNSGGNGPWSSQYNFTINTRPTVSDPGRYLDTHKPALNWTALPGAVKYDLWIDDKLGGVSQFIRDQNVATNSWTPATDMPLGLYHAWVRGIAADGTGGSWSVTTIFYVMPAPNVTQGINPTFDRTPDFAWDPLLGAVKYEVFIRNRVDGTTTLYQQNIAATNFSPPTALEDGPYRVWVLGVSAANVRSFWTNLIDIRVGGPTEILTPTGTTGDTTPTFTWQTMDGADHYDLWVDQIGGTTQVIREQNLIGTAYTPTTPLPLGSYRVWVRAISTTGEVSPWSVTVEFTIAQNDLPHTSQPDEDALLTILPLPLLSSTGASRHDVRRAPPQTPEFAVADQSVVVDDRFQAIAEPSAVAAGASEVHVNEAVAEWLDTAFAWWAERPVAIP